MSLTLDELANLLDDAVAYLNRIADALEAIATYLNAKP